MCIEHEGMNIWNSIEVEMINCILNIVHSVI